MTSKQVDETWVSRLINHMVGKGYARSSISNYTAEAKRFLSFIANRDINITTATPKDITSYLRRELRCYCRRHARAPRSLDEWRGPRATAIYMLLRLAQGRWPPLPFPSSPLGIFHAQICQEYAQWLTSFRRLAESTASERRAEASRFFVWLGNRGTQTSIAVLPPAIIDAYLTCRGPALCRRSRKLLATNLRSFLGYLFSRGCTVADLSKTVLAPRIYQFESLPSALRTKEVQSVVDTARSDRTVKGLRDYAIVMLLATYGLRAGEIVHLRLDDIDWRAETLCVRRTKTSTESILPLLPPVGEAIMDYLRAGRPSTRDREIFFRLSAPCQPLRSIDQLVQQRIKLAGVPTGRNRGPHAFRHARAVSLLRGGISVKQIGDILGHRSAASTAIYLRLATEDLRAIALDIPAEVAP